MLLDTLLARATGLPGFDFWRGLAPRRFLIDCLLVDLIRTFEVLPISKADGTFSVICTSPLGLTETLPEGWSEIARSGDHFAVFRAPIGTTSQEVTETLALELIPLFYPSEIYEDKLYAWLEKELGPDDDESEIIEEDPTDPRPHLPGSFMHPREKSEREQDLDFLYGNGRIPPQCHRYHEECGAQLDPTYGPPEVSDLEIQYAEESNFHYC